MRRVVAFNQVSLDGFFSDANGDMSWAHRDDEEWNAFVEGNASGGGELIFGRVTYELMAGFWPTPFAKESMPVVAARMNGMPKVVFSTTLNEATWTNTTLVKGDLAATVRRMKREPGEDMAILGSGSIVSQLTAEGLIDVFQIVVNPLVLGRGRTLFEGLPERVRLTLIDTRTFSNGNVLLCYEPVREEGEA